MSGRMMTMMMTLMTTTTRTTLNDTKDRTRIRITTMMMLAMMMLTMTMTMTMDAVWMDRLGTAKKAPVRPTSQPASQIPGVGYTPKAGEAPGPHVGVKTIN